MSFRSGRTEEYQIHGCVTYIFYLVIYRKAHRQMFRYSRHAHLWLCLSLVRKRRGINLWKKPRERHWVMNKMCAWIWCFHSWCAKNGNLTRLHPCKPFVLSLRLLLRKSLDLIPICHPFVRTSSLFGGFLVKSYFCESFRTRGIIFKYLIKRT